MEPELIDFISRTFLSGTTTGRLTADDDLLTTGLIDSLGVMRLVGFIESQFAISVPPRDVTIENFLNVRLIVNYVSARRRTSSAEQVHA